jgi:hypothetical protein
MMSGSVCRCNRYIVSSFRVHRTTCWHRSIAPGCCDVLELTFPASIQLAEAGVAVALRIALNVFVPEKRQCDVLALELAMNARKVWLDLTTVTLVSCSPSANSLASSTASVISSGSGQLRPAAWKRLIVARTVNAATSSRNDGRGRHHSGIVGVFLPESARWTRARPGPR